MMTFLEGFFSIFKRCVFCKLQSAQKGNICEYCLKMLYSKQAPCCKCAVELKVSESIICKTCLEKDLTNINFYLKPYHYNKLLTRSIKRAIKYSEAKHLKFLEYLISSTVKKFYSNLFNASTKYYSPAIPSHFCIFPPLKARFYKSLEPDLQMKYIAKDRLLRFPKDTYVLIISLQKNVSFDKLTFLTIDVLEIS